ncbi:MAG TPA: hypothetical protein VJ521_15080 [Acidobacteriota bacterium]|nr:hypothetical protein [Acidobacteriota bacterium]
MDTNIVIYILLAVFAAVILVVLVINASSIASFLAQAARDAPEILQRAALSFQHLAGAIVANAARFAQAIRGTFLNILHSVERAFEQTLEFAVEQFQRGLNSVTNLVFGVTAQIGSLGQRASMFISNGIGAIANFADDVVRDAITRLVLAIIGLIGKLIRFVIALFNSGIQGLVDLFNLIATAINTAVNAASSGVLIAINALTAAAQSVYDYLVGDILPILEDIYSLFSSIEDIF